jgi:hypothetical protein
MFAASTVILAVGCLLILKLQGSSEMDSSKRRF